MRTALLATAALIMQLLVAADASACRGPQPSISQIVESAPQIFIAKVGRRISESEYGGVIELLVAEVLKGSEAGMPFVHANELLSPNQKCGAMMARIPLPPIETGSEWLVSGSFDVDGKFEPIPGGSFRLGPGQQGMNDEERKRFLLEIRQTIQRMSKKSARTAP
jgi:hypothetical protein